MSPKQAEYRPGAPGWLTGQEAADLAGVTPATIREARRAGRLAARLREGRTYGWMIWRPALVAWMERRALQPKGRPHGAKDRPRPEGAPTRGRPRKVRIEGPRSENEAMIQAEGREWNPLAEFQDEGGDEPGPLAQFRTSEGGGKACSG
jgi:hypothetical protein